MKMRSQTRTPTSGKLSVRLVAIAPSSDFVWLRSRNPAVQFLCKVFVSLLLNLAAAAGDNAEVFMTRL